jgi:hypothetical protein
LIIFPFSATTALFRRGHGQPRAFHRFGTPWAIARDRGGLVLFRPGLMREGSMLTAAVLAFVADIQNLAGFLDRV